MAGRSASSPSGRRTRPLSDDSTAGPRAKQRRTGPKPVRPPGRSEMERSGNSEKICPLWKHRPSPHHPCGLEQSVFSGLAWTARRTGGDAEAKLGRRPSRPRGGLGHERGRAVQGGGLDRGPAAAGVAKLQLKAATETAAAQVGRGQAEAEVLLLSYQALAGPLSQAVQAFGGGDTYARFFVYQMLAPAVKSILASTEGPFADVFRALIPAGAVNHGAAQGGADRLTTGGGR